MFGSYLLAAYDPDNEQYQTISKIGTGFRCARLPRPSSRGALQQLLVDWVPAHLRACCDRSLSLCGHLLSVSCAPACSEELLKQLAEQMQGLVIPAAKSYYRWGLAWRLDRRQRGCGSDLGCAGAACCCGPPVHPSTAAAWLPTIAPLQVTPAHSSA